MSICIDLTTDIPQVVIYKPVVHKPKVHVPKVHKCGICLEEMSSPYYLGCHVFCKECIQSWVPNSATCPGCRGNIPSYVVEDLMKDIPRRSSRTSHATVMFTTDGISSSTVTSHEMMQRVEEIE